MRLIITLLTILAALTATAAPAPADSVAQVAEDSWSVSLLTCAPGTEIYELEGHSALRLRHSSGQPDIVVNWGLFDFASPGFVFRFTKGETDYWAGAAPTDYFIELYSRQGRSVTEQRLDLTPSESLRVFELIDENLRPENRVYRYNYIGDNCATRPLAIIERAIADTLTLGQPEQAIAEAGSFRRAMRYYHRDYPWYQFGIDLALGSTLDRREPLRSMTFSPVALEQMMAAAKRPDGRPIVVETIVTPATAEQAPPGPTPWYLTPLTWSIIVLLLTLAVTLRDLRRRRLSRLFDSLLFGLFGLDGCVIAFLVFISVHEAASPNWLLLWLNPFCLLVPLLIWSKGGRHLLMWWQFINFVALIGLCVVWTEGAQACNGAFIPLIVSDMVRSIYFIYYCRCISPSSHISSTRAVR